MDSLAYRLRMCVNRYDYEQRLEIYKEIADIATRNIKYYEERLDDKNDYNNVRKTSVDVESAECDDCCAKCGINDSCDVSCFRYGEYKMLCPHCRYK